MEMDAKKTKKFNFQEVKRHVVERYSCNETVRELSTRFRLDTDNDLQSAAGAAIPNVLKRHRVKQSIASLGNCNDNTTVRSNLRRSNES